MPEAQITKCYQEQQTSYDVKLDRFFICFGYKNRDSIQIRLEKNNVVYLCDDRESRPFDEVKTISAKVPFDLLAEHWPRFIVFLRAKAAEAAGGDETQDMLTHNIISR